MEEESHRNRHQRRKQMRVPGRDFQGRKSTLGLQFPVGSAAIDHPRTFSFDTVMLHVLDKWVWHIMTTTDRISPNPLRTPCLEKGGLKIVSHSSWCLLGSTDFCCAWAAAWGNLLIRISYLCPWESRWEMTAWRETLEQCRGLDEDDATRCFFLFLSCWEFCWFRNASGTGHSEFPPSRAVPAGWAPGGPRRHFVPPMGCGD